MTTALTTPADEGHAPEVAAPPHRPRLESVDLLRGLVMVIMVLDHVRDYFGNVQLNPTDPGTTTIALFFTRWITHFCAPTFVFLAGVGAFLAGSRGMSRSALSRFLFTRGLWLIFLELTVVRIGMTFDLTYGFIPLVVFWAIGASMVVLSALVYLPTAVVGVLGVATIVGHNALDGRVTAETLGRFGDLWRILHEGGKLKVSLGESTVFALYPLIPWVGVMAAGYAFGTVVISPDARKRRTTFLALGLSLTAAFVALRWSNLYGDPRRWTAQSRGPAYTAMSFLNCTKYPPSLDYLLMTLGPAIALLALLDRGLGTAGRPLATLGRVPLFYFVLQWPVIHVLAIVANLATGRPYRWLLSGGPFSAPESHVGYGLPVVYGMWVVTLLLLYPPCRWFAGVKRRRKDAWLSYL